MIGEVSVILLVYPKIPLRYCYIITIIIIILLLRQSGSTN
jgi:hypothetical protein